MLDYKWHGAFQLLPLYRDFGNGKHIFGSELPVPKTETKLNGNDSFFHFIVHIQQSLDLGYLVRRQLKVL